MSDQTVRVPDRPEVKAFLDDIKQHPDDVTLRLILADWLEEHDDPRGEFLRARCHMQFEDTAPSGIPCEKWATDAARLREAHEPLWLGRLTEHINDGWTWVGGLLQVEIRAENVPLPGEGNAPTLFGGLGRSIRQMFQLLSGSAESFAHDTLRRLAETETWAWVDEVTLTYVEVLRLAGLLASPLLRSVHKLELASLNLGVEGAVVLAESPDVDHLNALSFACNSIGPEGFGALAGSPYLAGLRYLNLYDNQSGDAGVTCLANSLFLRKLEKLNLAWNHLHSDGIIALAGSPILENVQFLCLDGAVFDEEAAFALAESPYLRRLKVLSLMDSEVLSQRGREALRKRFGDVIMGLDEDREEDETT